MHKSGVIFLLLFEVFNFFVDALVGFEFLLAHNQKVDTFDQHVNESDFRESESISVRDIKESAFSGTVNSTGSSFLESKFLQNISERFVFRYIRDFDVDTASNSGTKIGWASENVSEVFVPHELVASFFDSVLEFVQTVAPSCESLFHVAVLLHGDDSNVVFLVDPDQKVFGSVVPDTSSRWPVSGHTGGDQKRGNWFVEEKVVFDKSVLLFISHITKWVVFTGKFTTKTGQSIDNDLFDFASFGSAAPWWQAESSEGSTGSNSGRENVVHVKVFSDDFGWVQASNVFVVWFVTSVSGFNDWIEEFFENFVTLFVTSNSANSHNEWMTWVIDTGLNGIIDGVAGWSLSSSHSLVEFFVQNSGHVVVVFSEVREFLISGVVCFVKCHFECVVEFLSG